MLRKKTPSKNKKPRTMNRAPAGQSKEKPPVIVPLVEERLLPRGLGREAAGQAGDFMGLARTESAGPESVEELAEEGQAFEAGVLAGVEDAPAPERGPIRTKEVPEDDVPSEYLDDDRPGR